MQSRWPLLSCRLRDSWCLDTAYKDQRQKRCKSQSTFPHRVRRAFAQVDSPQQFHSLSAIAVIYDLVLAPGIPDPCHHITAQTPENYSWSALKSTECNGSIST
jgi:hypothetical protein